MMPLAPMPRRQRAWICAARHHACRDARKMPYLFLSPPRAMRLFCRYARRCRAPMTMLIIYFICRDIAFRCSFRHAAAPSAPRADMTMSSRRSSLPITSSVILASGHRSPIRPPSRLDVATVTQPMVFALPCHALLTALSSSSCRLLGYSRERLLILRFDLSYAMAIIDCLIIFVIVSRLPDFCSAAHHLCLHDFLPRFFNMLTDCYLFLPFAFRMFTLFTLVYYFFATPESAHATSLWFCYMPLRLMLLR